MNEELNKINEMSEKAEEILDRYKKQYVTDSQLLRYLMFNVITQEEYNKIYQSKNQWSW